MSVRIMQHNTGRNASTRSGIPWDIKYTEEYTTRSEAQFREMEIKKKKSRKYIEWLISSVVWSVPTDVGKVVGSTPILSILKSP